MESHHLAKQLKNETIIAVNPGSLLNTKIIKKTYGQYWDSSHKGAKILYELTNTKEHVLHSGEYFDNDSAMYAKAHVDTYNTNSVNNLIELTKKNIE